MFIEIRIIYNKTLQWLFKTWILLIESNQRYRNELIFYGIMSNQGIIFEFILLLTHFHYSKSFLEGIKV